MQIIVCWDIAKRVVFISWIRPCLDLCWLCLWLSSLLPQFPALNHCVSYTGLPIARKSQKRGKATKWCSKNLIAIWDVHSMIQYIGLYTMQHKCKENYHPLFFIAPKKAFPLSWELHSCKLVLADFPEPFSPLPLPHFLAFSEGPLTLKRALSSAESCSVRR